MKDIVKLQNGYRVNRLNFTVDGSDLLVTLDQASGLFDTIRMNSYANEDEAWNAAYRQAKSNR